MLSFCADLKTLQGVRIKSLDIRKHPLAQKILWRYPPKKVSGDTPSKSLVIGLVAKQPSMLAYYLFDFLSEKGTDKRPFNRTIGILGDIDRKSVV